MVLKFTREEIFLPVRCINFVYKGSLYMDTSMLMQQRLLIRNRNKESKFSNRAPLMRCKFKLRTHHRLVSTRSISLLASRYCQSQITANESETRAISSPFLLPAFVSQFPHAFSNVTLGNLGECVLSLKVNG